MLSKMLPSCRHNKNKARPRQTAREILFRVVTLLTEAPLIYRSVLNIIITFQYITTGYF